MPASQSATAHRLLQLGVLLFLIGLVVGLTLPVLANPRMGLASHMEGVMNGLFLIALGLVWPKLTSSPGMQRLTFLLAVYGTFATLVATFLSAAWGAGAPMMPIAAGGHEGDRQQRDPQRRLHPEVRGDGRADRERAHRRVGHRHDDGPDEPRRAVRAAEGEPGRLARDRRVGDGQRSLT